MKVTKATDYLPSWCKINKYNFSDVCREDRLYPRYFRHINADRMQVGVISQFRCYFCSSKRPPKLEIKTRRLMTVIVIHWLALFQFVLLFLLALSAYQVLLSILDNKWLQAGERFFNKFIRYTFHSLHGQYNEMNPIQLNSIYICIYRSLQAITTSFKIPYLRYSRHPVLLLLRCRRASAHLPGLHSMHSPSRRQRSDHFVDPGGVLVGEWARYF